MNRPGSYRRRICLAALLTLLAGILSACSLNRNADIAALTGQTEEDASGQNDSALSGYLVAIEDEPDTVDFQCTTIHYTIAQNVFDRLVEMDHDEGGSAQILPSLAQSWEISDDRRCYTFHLRKGVTFSNGAGLTSEDVRYTFIRLLTHPDSCNRDIADPIAGAKELEEGKTEELKGFRVLSDLEFTITLEEPFEAFLACLSMPGASILDAETTQEAGDRFGTGSRLDGGNRFLYPAYLEEVAGHDPHSQSQLLAGRAEVFGTESSLPDGS